MTGGEAGRVPPGGVVVGHLVRVAVVVGGVVRVEVGPLGGGRGRRQGLLRLVAVHLTAGGSGHQVVPHLAHLLHHRALLLLPLHHADDDADQQEDRHHRETHHEDHDEGGLRCEGFRF